MDLGIYLGYVMIFSQFLIKAITVGTVFFRIRLVDRLSRDVDMVLQKYSSLFERSLRMKDLYSLFVAEPSFADGTKRLPKLDKGPDIKITNLDFTYPRSESRVLNDITLTVKSGEKVAIVGHNGAGKTTLVKLLSRMYLPTDGEILVNGIAMKDIAIETLYQNMGVLFQEFNTYDHLSVKDNVVIGDTKRLYSEEDLVDALDRADALDFVNSYPNKFDQILSEKFDGGIRPSWGQWQKIAIARFFYRNAPFVIFDEPTAAIDAVSEYNIFNKIYSFFEGKTVILISHRFSTVRNADRIIVLEKGRIIEEGSHEELMEKNGSYAESFKLQAEGYSIAS
jgi:ATP-binding cassette subfamily B protein